MHLCPRKSSPSKVIDACHMRKKVAPVVFERSSPINVQARDPLTRWSRAHKHNRHLAKRTCLLVHHLVIDFLNILYKEGAGKSAFNDPSSRTMALHRHMPNHTHANRISGNT